MKTLFRSLVLTAGLALPVAAFATSMADVVKAQVVLNQVLQLAAKFNTVQLADIPAPEPLPNTSGRYLLPYTDDGALTDWASKALNTQVGAAIGEKAGEEAGKQLASRVPFGGLASGFMKKKGKETGAIIALGGKDYLKKTSSLSFNNLDDYAVYLHVKHSAEPGYAEAMAAAMAVYPDLEKGYDNALKKAYKTAQKAQ